MKRLITNFLFSPGYRWRVFLPLALGLGLNVSAHAQYATRNEYIPTVTKKRGRGVGLGRGAKSRLHLELDAAVGYNTNPYSLAATDKNPRNKGDIIIKLHPGIALEAKGRKLALEMGLNGRFGVLPDIANSGQNATWLLFTGNLYGNAEFNRGGALSLYVRDNLTTTRRPAELFVSDLLRIRNNAVIGTAIRPGGGALTIQVDGQHGFEYWPPDTVVTGGNPTGIGFDSEELYAHARFNWRFLPRTSGFLDVRGGTYRPRNETKASITPIWARVGATGRVSEKITGTLSLGYANPFIYDEVKKKATSTNLVGVTFVANANWQIAKKTALSVSALRDMVPVPLFYDVTPMVLDLRFVHWFGKISFDFQGTGNFMTFGKPLDKREDAKVRNRQDLLVDVKLGLTYQVREWFGIGISNRTDLRWTNTSIDEVLGRGEKAMVGSDQYSMLYTKNETLLVLSMHY